MTFRKLLAIGADPNAQIGYSSCTYSVFAIYLILSLSYQATGVNVQSYLSTLDVFLDHGADFWQPLTYNSGTEALGKRLWWPTEVESKFTTVENVLSLGLRLLGFDPQIM